MNTAQEQSKYSDIEEMEWGQPRPQSGDFLFLTEDQPSVDVRIVSRPYAFSEIGKDKDGKAFTKRGYAYLVIWRNPHGEDQVKVLKAAGTVYDDLARLFQNPQWGNPNGYDVQVSRSGSGLNTKYSVQPLRNTEAITEDEKKMIADSGVTVMGALTGDQFMEADR